MSCRLAEVVIRPAANLRYEISDFKLKRLGRQGMQTWFSHVAQDCLHVAFDRAQRRLSHSHTLSVASDGSAAILHSLDFGE